LPEHVNEFQLFSWLQWANSDVGLCSLDRDALVRVVTIMLERLGRENTGRVRFIQGRQGLVEVYLDGEPSMTQDAKSCVIVLSRTTPGSSSVVATVKPPGGESISQKTKVPCRTDLNLVFEALRELNTENQLDALSTNNLVEFIIRELRQVSPLRSATITIV
jgi:hypothetical protein